MIIIHDEISSIITALGCGIEEEFNLEKLRYHKAIIMTDSDADGVHIRPLLLTFFYRQMPQLLEGGFVYIAQPPLYGVRTGRSSIQYLQKEEEMTDYLLGRGIKDVVISRQNAVSINISGDEEIREILKMAEKYDSLYRRITNKGFTLEDIKAMDPERLPLYKVESSDGDEKILYSQEELKHLKQDFFQDLDEETLMEEDSFKVIDLWELKPLIEIRQKLSEKDVDIDAKDYSVAWNGDDTDELGDLFSVMEKIKRRGSRGVNVQRYKGLGEMNPSQLWETTMEPGARKLLRVKLDDAVEADKIFTTLMGDKVEPRRKFIEKHARRVRNLDT